MYWHPVILESEMVVPDIPAATAMVESMNGNMAGFLLFYLKDQGLPSSFIEELVQTACDPALLHEAGKCTWDAKTCTLTTPRDEERKKEKEIEEMAWYKDFHGAFMEESPRKGRKAQAAPEYLYDLDGKHSVKTLSGRPSKTYEGSPGAPVFQVGGKARQAKQGKSEESEPEVIDVEEGEDFPDDLSQLSTMSKDELVKLARDLHRKSKLAAKQPGSGPGKSASEESPSDSSSEEGSSSSSDGSDSASGSSEESSSSVGDQDKPTDNEEHADGEEGAMGG